MGDDEAGLDLALAHALQQRAHEALHVHPPDSRIGERFMIAPNGTLSRKARHTRATIEAKGWQVADAGKERWGERDSITAHPAT
jgi:hypothetical protein